MTKVEYSPTAFKDLQEIHSYILSNWGEKVAERFLKKISSDIRGLEQFPALGVALAKMVDVPTDYRYLFSEKNCVFFRLESDKIRIVRIINENHDYMEHLLIKGSASNDDGDSE